MVTQISKQSVATPLVLGPQKSAPKKLAASIAPDSFSAGAATTSWRDWAFTAIDRIDAAVLELFDAPGKLMELARKAGRNLVNSESDSALKNAAAPGSGVGQLTMMPGETVYLALPAFWVSPATVYVKATYREDGNVELETKGRGISAQLWSDDRRRVEREYLSNNGQVVLPAEDFARASIGVTGVDGRVFEYNTYPGQPPMQDWLQWSLEMSRPMADSTDDSGARIISALNQ